MSRRTTAALGAMLLLLVGLIAARREHDSLCDHLSAAASHASAAAHEGSLSAQEAVQSAATGLFGRPTTNIEHPRFYDYRASNDGAAQQWLAAHGHDTAHVDAGSSDTSVYGKLTEGLRAGLGLDATEAPHDAAAGSLADRLASAWASLRGHTRGHAAADQEAPPTLHVGGRDVSYSDLAHELALAAGVQSPTAIERIKGVLEALRVAPASPATLLARDIATHHEELSSLSREEREGLLNSAGRSAGGGGTWDALLKTIGVRAASPLDKAASEWAAALHEISVAAGGESPHLLERLRSAAESAREALAPLVAAPAEWQQQEHAPASDAWHDAAACGLAATISARDAALASYDSALKRAGLRPEQRSVLARAHENLEAATDSLWALLGYGPQPGRWERLQAYTRHGIQRALQQPAHWLQQHADDVTHSPLDAASQFATRTGRALGGYVDSGLKRSGLRPYDYSDYVTSLPLARDAFNAALRRVHASLPGAGAPSTALQHVEHALAGAADRVAHTLAELHSSLAPLLTAASRPGGRAGLAHHVAEQAAETYAATIERARTQMDAARRSTEAALESAGLQPHHHSAHAQLASAWHDLGTRLGLGASSASSSTSFFSPDRWTTGSAASSTLDALRHAGATAGSAAERLLQQAGLHDHTALEAASGRAHMALHALKVAVGAADPTAAEALAAAYAHPQRALQRALGSLASLLPEHMGASLKSSVGYPSGAAVSTAGLTELGHAYVEDAQQRALQAVYAARAGVDRALKACKGRGGACTRPAVEAAHDALDAQLRSLVTTLSAPPSSRSTAASSAAPGGGLAHRAKVLAGWQQPTLAESAAAALHTGREAAAGWLEDAGGGAFFPTIHKPSLWARMKGF